MRPRFDAVVVGAGIVGLAHAYHLAKSGQKVGVFERSPQAMGASVRNFGMLWPIGQPAGRMHRLALRSREVWREVLRESGLWHAEVGSLHLAYQDDERQVLQEFLDKSEEEGFDCALLSPAQIAAKSDVVKQDGLLTGLWSPTEICVDPRQIVAELPAFLHRRYGVAFHFDTAVTAIDAPKLTAGGSEWEASRIFVCSGDDFQTLYPEILLASGITRCKLQMLRSEPMGDSWRLGPMLAAGLTLNHYKSFAHCPSLYLLKLRIATELPDYERYGIHVMASQNGKGEVVLGDSHEYGNVVEPFDKPEIDALVLAYLNSFLNTSEIKIASRWHGVYGKHATDPYFVHSPAANVTIVTGIGGAGMTLSFGVAEEVVTGKL